MHHAKILAIHYLLSCKDKGEPLPNDSQKTLMLMLVQLRMELEEDALADILEAVEPFSALINLVKKIQADGNNREISIL